MEKEAKRFNMFIFISEIEDRYNIFRGLKDRYEGVYTDDVKKVIDEYNVIEEIIKVNGIEHQVRFSKLYWIYSTLSDKEYFETSYRYEEYRKQFIEKDIKEDALKEFIDLQIKVMFSEYTLEQVIQEAKYHNELGCELLYKIAKQVKSVVHERVTCMSDVDWENYLHGLKVYEQMLGMGIDKKLVESTVNVTVLDVNIYNYRKGDKGTYLLKMD